MKPTPPPAHQISSTYRLQLHPAFPFSKAAALVPYLQCLGITDCYVSPILAASPGSSHGYDVCDPQRVNPELEGEEGLQLFSQVLRENKMGLVVDFVPNHMGIHVTANARWRDVLENGQSSPYARFFDIDWNPLKEELRGKVLLPILGDQYGVALDSGQLQIELRDGEFGVRYFEDVLPLNPRGLPILLRHNLDSLRKHLGESDPNFNEFLSIIFHLDHLPAYTRTDPESVGARHREKEVAKRRLASLAASSRAVRLHIDNNIRIFNGVPGESASFNLLHELLEAQAYRLSSWKTAMHEINYRRFFDVNELAGLRMEDPRVFGEVHAHLFDLIQKNVITGVRLDHIDGLFDPSAYLRQFRERCSCPVYLVVEKILMDGEQLPKDWDIDGTTGYDFLNLLNSLYVDSSSSREFSKLQERFTGDKLSLSDVIYNAKKLIITTSMASELTVLASQLNRISESNRHFRDFTLDSIQAALVEVAACFPVYRTYFSPRGWSDFDERIINIAIEEALRRNPAMESTVFEFIRQMLLPSPDGISSEEYARRTSFAMKFQQYTGPVQAKGVEDTAFYRYGPLLSLNEVGGNPGRFGRSPESFHEANRLRLEQWPQAMLSTGTHDTKRGEDARARLNVVSEIPQEWRKAVSQWSRINASARTLVHGNPAPDRSDEYFFYQALLGAWPAESKSPDCRFVDRMQEYMRKATKEKKIHTSWISGSEAYDNAVSGFVQRTLTGDRSKIFLKSFLPLLERIARLGAVNSLSQLLLKIASPGVPDFYQGVEFWDLRLVDPDNRGPVDFDIRIRQLETLGLLLDGKRPSNEVTSAVQEMVENWEDGRIKQYLTAIGLRARRHLPDLFLHGEYRDLHADGIGKDHIVAFARTRGPQILIAIAPRLVGKITGSARWPLGADAWNDSRLEIQSEWSSLQFRDLITTRTLRPDPGLPIADALRFSPAALLLATTETGS